MNRIHDGEAPMFEPHVYKVGSSHYSVVFEPAGIELAAGWSTIDEDVTLIMLDTSASTGRIRIEMNDGVIWDGDPEFSNPLCQAIELLTATYQEYLDGFDPSPNVPGEAYASPLSFERWFNDLDI